MNCSTCGIEYKDDVPHPPKACLDHASSEMKKAQAALNGALDQISIAANERDKIKKLVRKIVAKEADSNRYVLKDMPKALEELYKLVYAEKV